MKSKTTPPRRLGPATLVGSREAKRIAAGLLEVLSGVRGPKDGSAALGISLNRYYQLETRALQGFLAALEPKPKGRQKRPEDRLAALERDKRRLEQELARHQALVRAAQRSLGLPGLAREEAGNKGRGRGKGTARRRSRGIRGLKAVAVLRSGVDAPERAAASGASEGR
jgi:hypothetical protein